MPIPLARWRDASANATPVCPCGIVVDADEEDDLAVRFAPQLHDCPLGRTAAASVYVAGQAERG